MSKLRALLVGAGGMGRAWAGNLYGRRDMELAGWMDILPDAAGKAIADLKFADVKAFGDLNKALSELKPDFVVDASIPEAHHQVTLDSLAAGAAVLGEKPMAHSMQHAREMIQASERWGKLYMISQHRRYDPRAVAFADAIRKHVGPPAVLCSDFFLPARVEGFRKQMDHPLLIDMAIHTFDAARQISGTDPIDVYCEEFNPPWSWFKGNAGASAIFHMTGNLRYEYRGCWCAEGLTTSWQGQWRAYGPQGAAEWDGDSEPIAHPVNGKKTVEKCREMQHQGIAGSLHEFLHALKTGTIPQGECHENIKSLAMVFAAIESTTTGKRVEVSP
ncbi:MAG: Gfo/Idh/MocA family oxidoreductase [Tepidisphaeraceae bacterium]